MKTKKNITAQASLKVLSVLPLIILLFVILSSCSAAKRSAKTSLNSSPAVSSAQQEEPYVVVEEMPLFPGGDSTLLAFIGNNIHYPESAKTNKVQGRVIVRFCVTSSGSVDRISVLRGVSPELDAEATRVVSTLPEFIPGRQGGKNVPVWYMVPITFALK